MSILSRSLAVGATLLALAACGSPAADPAAPHASAPAAAVQPSNWQFGTVTTTFQSSPTQTVSRYLGNNTWISIPAGAVCDLATTRYGTRFWSDPCADATTPVTITAVSWIDDKGQTQTSFSPALRFDPSKTVLLQFMKQSQSGTVLYCPLDGDLSSCYDESLTDPSLATFWINGAYLQRRIKHFSGYLVAVG